jgi:hypothetical protein
VRPGEFYSAAPLWQSVSRVSVSTSTPKAIIEKLSEYALERAQIVVRGDDGKSSLIEPGNDLR